MRSGSAACANPTNAMLEEPQNEQSPPPPQLQTYHLRSINSSITIRQLPSQGLSFQLWPAACALVSLMDSEPTTLFDGHGRRLRILELGSGTGVVGIAAAALLGAELTVTDLPHVLENLQYNVEANGEVVAGRGGAVRVAALTWGDVEQMEGVGREFDVVLGTDVVYHEHLYEPLLQTLRFLLMGEGGVVFVMAHLKRWKKESAFFKKANKLFHVHLIHTEPPVTPSRVGIKVYKFLRRTAVGPISK